MILARSYFLSVSRYFFSATYSQYLIFLPWNDVLSRGFALSLSSLYLSEIENAFFLSQISTIFFAKSSNQMGPPYFLKTNVTTNGGFRSISQLLRRDILVIQWGSLQLLGFRDKNWRGPICLPVQYLHRNERHCHLADLQRYFIHRIRKVTWSYLPYSIDIEYFYLIKDWI